MEIEHRLNELKTEFSQITELKEENTNIFIILEDRINKLKSSYNEFISNNKQNLFVFGLDSFHFQGKLIDIEYDDTKRLFNAITNRMYCEYYKLHKIINEYVTENISDKKILEVAKVNNNFPVYKDLEPFKQYDFTFIQQLHELIISILHSLCSFLMTKEHDLKNYQNKNKTGLNIDNFVNTFNFNNVVMKEKVTLFITYIEFFHKLHSKYLKRFTTKIQLLISQINYDIKFEDVGKPDAAKKNVLQTLKDEIKDKTLLKSLRSNMSDNDDLSVGSETLNKTIEKNQSDDSFTDESGRSNSDASEKEFKGLSLNNEGSGSISKSNSRVQFVISDERNANNTVNVINVDTPKSIIKTPSPVNLENNLNDNFDEEMRNNDRLLLEELHLIEVQNPNDECLSGLTVDSDVCSPRMLSTRYKLLEPENSDQETSTIAKEEEVEEEVEVEEEDEDVSSEPEPEPELTLQLLSDSLSEPVELSTENIAL